MVGVAGLRAERVAEILVTLPDGRARRGSGYLVSSGKVLTAAHVVADATGIRVRFDADQPGEWMVGAAVEWAHTVIDTAVLTLPGTGRDTGHVTPSAFARVDERDVELHCSATGFPRFKLRNDEDGTRYRDSEHINASCAVLSSRREGTFDLTVTPPAAYPDPQTSPWEGMSGAAVFSSGRIIGIVGKHHLSDGLGRLAAYRVDRWARELSPDELGQLEQALGCRLSPEHLPDVAPPSSPAWKVLDRYAGMLRDHTRPRLTDTHSHLELDRRSARHDLVQRLAEAASGPGALVILGEPDVGKSALTLRAVEDLRQTDATVACAGLRHLPSSVTALESELGAPLSEVLQEAEAIPVRLLVIDGAEAVLEGRRQLLTDLAAAALRAGFGVAAVTRTDAARAVSEALQQAADTLDLALSGARPAEHEVQRLTHAEAEELTQTFPAVARFGQQPRAAWLLGRPGLVDLLLRADAAQALPDGALSEADVFAAVWSQLVRRGEDAPAGGPSPDDREQAMLALARRRLLPDSTSLAAPDSAALPSLRSDGLLLPAGPHRAWRPADDFASDLVRDFAVAHLLLTDGWELMEAAGAPRWTLRAVRLACQVTLADARSDSEPTRRRLQQVFDALAVDHGDRWGELPFEALLTLGSAAEALAAAWPALTEEHPDQLTLLVRLALDGHSRHGVGDPVILAPLVELTYGTGLYPDNGDAPHTSPGIAPLVRRLALVWLRGLADANAEALPLRQRVRDVLLDAEPAQHDEFAVEAIAMLGADLDTRAEGFLHALAEDGGRFLAPAVESGHVARSMSRTRPKLLLSLAEAYYIKKPRTGDLWYSQPDPLDEGVRRHTQWSGAFAPMAGWNFGPFFPLLAAKPTETLQMIHRLMDHAAAKRVGRRASNRQRELEGLELDLPGAGRRLCVGDEHVWSWYRGTSVGPYPCMSALLAVEVFADHLIETLGLPLSEVTGLLLRGCGNLAMPGLVVGLLVRHLERAGTELDRWLIRPEIWHLETLRAVAELNSHVQGPDPADVAGRDRRRLTFLDVSTQMTVTALLAGNQERLTVLHGLGDELLRHAGDEVFGEQIGAESNTLTMIKGWAGRLQARNYHFVELGDGRNGLSYEPPPDVVAELAAENAELARGQQAIRLLTTYAVNEDRSAPLDTLASDLELARTLAADPPAQGSLYPMDPMVGTAAAAMVAHADGHIDLAEDAIDWAASLVLDAALHPHEGGYAGMSSLHSMGADRSAAIGVPPRLPALGIRPEWCAELTQ
ncbi:trypsin-like peptidase domain-containing protein [Streptomyces sp. NPDC058052]|uniref:trypsin-like peptidase domain-containing protein n=1 Tax=Streptomyces sp. NPDC058052 TaxID=3346316 RepID=UPI0036E7C481